jgi:hypothetical protein
MVARRFYGCRSLVLCALILAVCVPCRADPSAQGGLTLIVLPPREELMLSHHARPLSRIESGVLATFATPLIAAPIIRASAAQRMDPLPPEWRTDQPDRGFAERLSEALNAADPAKPWASVRIANSGEEIDRLIDEQTGRDVLVALVQYELVDLKGQVQFSANAQVTKISAAGTPGQSRAQSQIQEVSALLPADNVGLENTKVFGAAGLLDQSVAAAADRLSRSLGELLQGAARRETLPSNR